MEKEIKIQSDFNITIKEGGISSYTSSNFLEDNIARLASVENLLIKIEAVLPDRTEGFFCQEGFINFDKNIWKVFNILSEEEKIIQPISYLVHFKDIGAYFLGEGKTLIEQLRFIFKVRIAHRLNILTIEDTR